MIPWDRSRRGFPSHHHAPAGAVHPKEICVRTHRGVSGGSRTLGARRSRSLLCRMPRRTYRVPSFAVRAALFLVALAASTAPAQGASPTRIRAVVLQRDAVFDSV